MHVKIPWFLTAASRKRKLVNKFSSGYGTKRPRFIEEKIISFHEPELSNKKFITQESVVPWIPYPVFRKVPTDTLLTSAEEEFKTDSNDMLKLLKK